jgi:hypothetical protein
MCMRRELAILHVALTQRQASTGAARACLARIRFDALPSACTAGRWLTYLFYA